MMQKLNQTLSIILFPFKDLTFFHKDLIIELVNENKKKEELLKNKKFNEIYDVLISKISSEFKVRNIDEIKLIFDKYYNIINKLGKINENDVYNEYLHSIENVSTCLISHRDGKIVYKYWRNALDEEFLGPYDDLKKVEIFHNISKMISMDLFVVMYLVKNNKKIDQLYNFYSNICLADMQLDDVLVKGVAENHVHASATFNFNLTWEQIVNEKVDYNLLSKMKFSCVVDQEFKVNPVKYIKYATILRILFCLFLSETYKKDNCKFSEFLGGGFNKEDDEKGTKLNDNFQQLFDSENINEINEFELNNTLNLIKKYYSIIRGDSEKDIVFLILNECNGIKTYGENILLFKCIEYMKTIGEKDVLFKEGFFNYIRIKNEFYGQLVQRKVIDGLDNFQEHFHRGTAFIYESQRNNMEYYKLMLRTIFQNEYLRKIELRFSIYEENYLKKMVLEILLAYKMVLDEDFIEDEIEIPKLGIIFHLIKQRDETLYNKCWLRFDEENEMSYSEISFKKNQELYKKQINTVKKLRDEIPYLSYFILGIDAASLENNTPVEVFAPVYSIARDSKDDPLINFDSEGRAIKNKSLAFTFHAGEDFRHIISGLRRMYELIEYCKFHSGDRIGHGTALGISAEKWTKNNPVIIIPRGEYLNNLLWIWAIYSKQIENNLKVNLYLEQEIYRIAKDIFQDMSGITTTMLYYAYKNRFKEFKRKFDDKEVCNEDDVNEKDYKIFCIRAKKDHRIIWDIEKINHAYQCACYLKCIDEPIFVSVKEMDIGIIKDMQNYLINVLAYKGIIVEVNPSSNAVIGEMEEMFENQAYKINKINNKEHNNIMISINSDDPMIFNTNISNEYAYMYYGLLDKGYGKEQALEWIEKLRKCGMETSFIDNKISDKKYYDYLCRVIRELQ